MRGYPRLEQMVRSKQNPLWWLQLIQVRPMSKPIACCSLPRRRELSGLLRTSVSHYSSSALPFCGIHTFQPAVKTRLLIHALQRNNGQAQHGLDYRTGSLWAQDNGLFFPCNISKTSPHSYSWFSSSYVISSHLVYFRNLLWSSAHLYSLSLLQIILHLLIMQYSLFDTLFLAPHLHDCK